jgi:dihydrofolate reductase
LARLIYSVIASLDGFIEDAEGGFGWAAPDHDVHAAVNEMERSVGTYLYGRRMYETMAVWQEPEGTLDGSPEVRDYAGIWQAAEKIVYSTSLDAVSTPKTTLERSFEPDAVLALKSSAESDISIGGPALAAHAIRARLVDEFNFFLHPIVIGSGKPALPADVRIDLALKSERRFANGLVHLRYST